MLLVAETIDNHVFHSFQVRQFRVGNGLHVGDVGKVIDTEAHDGQFTVHHTDGEDIHIAMLRFTFPLLEGTQFFPHLLAFHLHCIFQIFVSHRHFLHIFYNNGHVRFNLYQIDGWNTWIAFLLRGETIRNAFHQVVGTELFGIDIHIAKDAIGTQVVESTHMVIVLMCDEHGIKRFEVDAKHLLTEIGSTVNKDTLATHFNQCRSAQPLVLRICRCANLTRTPYLRHSTRGSRTKYCDFHKIISSLLQDGCRCRTYRVHPCRWCRTDG